uniref:Uncharacterized protein n=1 Tax=Parascaris univalens TaxID=6257 RepID=A0A915CLQ1_PARUN
MHVDFLKKRYHLVRVDSSTEDEYSLVDVDSFKRRDYYWSDVDSHEEIFIGFGRRFLNEEDNLHLSERRFSNEENSVDRTSIPSSEGDIIGRHAISTKTIIQIGRGTSILQAKIFIGDPGRRFVKQEEMSLGRTSILTRDIHWSDVDSSTNI